MATAVLLEFNGITEKEYDRVIDALHLDQNPPKGGILHMAGRIQNGLRVVDIWESRNHFDTFLKDRLTPVFKQVGVSNPRVEYFDVLNVYAPQLNLLNTLSRGVPTR